MAISPVTQTALVDVKSASTNVTVAPSFTEHGSKSSRAPMKITMANPDVMTSPGD